MAKKKRKKSTRELALRLIIYIVCAAALCIGFGLYVHNRSLTEKKEAEEAAAAKYQAEQAARAREAAEAAEKAAKKAERDRKLGKMMQELSRKFGDNAVVRGNALPSGPGDDPYESSDN